MTECGKYNTIGSRCAEPLNHQGAHRSRFGATWTDESNERAIAAILEQEKRWTRD